MARLNTRPSVLSASSRHASETPQPGGSSDQENRDPSATARAKGKQRAMPRPQQRSSLPTPTSDGGDASRGQKRKRVELQPTSGAGDTDGQLERFNRFFDPNQDPEVRRQVKRKSRALEREFQGTWARDVIAKMREC